MSLHYDKKLLPYYNAYVNVSSSVAKYRFLPQVKKTSDTFYSMANYFAQIPFVQVFSKMLFVALK